MSMPTPRAIVSHSYHGRRRDVRRCELDAAARSLFQLDQDFAEAFAARVDSSLRRAWWHEEHAARLHGNLDAPDAFDLRVYLRAFDDAQQVRKIVAVAVGG